VPLETGAVSVSDPTPTERRGGRVLVGVCIVGVVVILWLVVGHFVMHWY
jgi:hypothetical protein